MRIQKIEGNEDKKDESVTEEPQSVLLGSAGLFPRQNIFWRFVASWQVKHEVNMQTVPIYSRGSEADGGEPLVQMVLVRAPALWV